MTQSVKITVTNEENEPMIFWVKPNTIPTTVKTIKDYVLAYVALEKEGITDIHHKEDGPAVEEPTYGYKEYWLNGVHIGFDEEEFKRQLHNRDFDSRLQNLENKS
jgi:hypothetical protein